ncbi:MAG TPA: hypothetical protein VKT82_10555 [Ktedonobacterales bacterium]|nr:hypothetical protein [Ktedonobacterales bacterium]
MQHLTLRPGLLTFRGEDWGTAGHPVVYDEQHSTIHCGRRLARLSPLEYTLVMALLRQRERAQTAPAPTAFCVTLKRLCHLSGSESELSIRRTLTEARLKVEGLGLRVIRLYGENRYCVLFATEVEGEDEEEAEDLRMVRSSQ